MSQPRTQPASIHHVPERYLPIPRHASEQAKAYLAQGRIERPPAPALDDLEGWRAYAAEIDAAIAAILEPAAAAHPCAVEKQLAGQAPLYRLTPQHLDPELADCAMLFIHGGGYLIGGGRSAATWPQPIADRAGIVAWSTDYRMPPDHPYPAALDDALAAYRRVLESHPAERIVLMGISAGGGLAAALVLRARDEGLPLPAGCIMHSPEVDLTEAGDSFATNAGVDQSLGSLMAWNLLYAGAERLDHPYLSPLFGDLANFPSAILTCGTRDLFLSNTVLMHRALRRAGCDARLHVWEAMSHSTFQGQAPEDTEIEDEQIAFLREILTRRAG